MCSSVCSSLKAFSPIDATSVLLCVFNPPILWDSSEMLRWGRQGGGEGGPKGRGKDPASFGILFFTSFASHCYDLITSSNSVRLGIPPPPRAVDRDQLGSFRIFKDSMGLLSTGCNICAAPGVFGAAVEVEEDLLLLPFLLVLLDVGDVGRRRRRRSVVIRAPSGAAPFVFISPYFYILAILPCSILLRRDEGHPESGIH